MSLFKLFDPSGDGEYLLVSALLDARGVERVVGSEIEVVRAADYRHRNYARIARVGRQNPGAAPRVQIPVGKDDVGGGEDVAAPETNGVLARGRRENG